jgi:uncharacterized protein (DUF1810 family)
MCFIFPQIEWLGSSATAKRYAIKGLPEAKAYICNPILVQRLIECCKTPFTPDYGAHTPRYAAIRKTAGG